ncbi:helix-turn-helix domain-containing protein, partial [Chloroflexota bacterium]
IIKTRIFDFGNNGCRNLAELAQAMGISVSQIYRVREGKRHINQKFIIGAIKAFPNYKLDDLFYLVSELPTVNNDNQQHLAIHAADKPAAREKQMSAST